MKRTLALATAGLALSLLAAPAAAESLRLLSGWGPNDRTTYSPVARFEENVEAMSGGDILIEVSGPEVVSPFEQLEPVTAGVFDILYTHGAYHVGSQGLSVTNDAMDGDPIRRRSSGAWDLLDKYYQETHGLKLLATPSVGTQGYHCYLREPLTEAGDWQGRRIRGVAVFHGLIESLGGVPVVMPIGEIYSSLERGVIDGACAPAAGMLANKHYEVAKYRVVPTFGQSIPIFAMNLDKWNGLTPEQQKLLLDAGYRTELETPWIGDAYLAEERAALAEAGVEVLVLPPEKAKLANDTFRESVWALGVECCGPAAEELRATARKGGVTN